MKRALPFDDEYDCPSRTERLFKIRPEQLHEDYGKCCLMVSPEEYKEFLNDMWNIRRKSAMLEYAAEIWFSDAKAHNYSTEGRWCCTDCNIVFNIYIVSPIDFVDDRTRPEEEEGYEYQLSTEDKKIVEGICRVANRDHRSCDVQYAQV